MRTGKTAAIRVLLLSIAGVAGSAEVTLDAPSSVARFDSAEFVIRLDKSPFGNPFTEAEVAGEFRLPGNRPIRVSGFADSEDGTLFRLRFSPHVAAATYDYKLRLRGKGIDREFSGKLSSTRSAGRAGPVIVDPRNPKHFVYMGSGARFHHLGYTAYHLLDPSNDDAQVDATIDYCARMGFNKIRFLLTGYPRDTDRRSPSEKIEAPGTRKAINYNSRPGQVNALPAWPGKPHAYDFARFDVDYWRRVERAIARMRDRGIVATCIVTIEKQNLPQEYGALTEEEYRLYKYAVARLAAFDNVWWDLGNEHNEFRDVEWGNAMGAFIKAIDPYNRLSSAHAYAEFFYPFADWADFIVTQHYGDEQAVHEWTLKHGSIPKPYVNEEYGYEGGADKPGHEQNSDWVRRCHWSIAMAGGYATYGDWSNGISYFYMGEPGPGKAARELKHLRRFFEELPFPEMHPEDGLTTNGFCLAKRPSYYVFYFPRGGTSEIDLAGAVNRKLAARWFDPRLGQWRNGPAVKAGKNTVSAPAAGDWVLLVVGEQ
ncbi:MAG: DUF4038 domain-containing protein [Bryobacteraceae bacterium]